MIYKVYMGTFLQNKKEMDGYIMWKQMTDSVVMIKVVIPHEETIKLLKSISYGKKEK